jgi:hypothetical protein
MALTSSACPGWSCGPMLGKAHGSVRHVGSICLTVSLVSSACPGRSCEPMLGKAHGSVRHVGLIRLTVSLVSSACPGRSCGHVRRAEGVCLTGCHMRLFEHFSVFGFILLPSRVRARPCILWLAFVRADNVGDSESGSGLDFSGASQN